MSQSAHVRSIDTLQEFRAHLLTFCERVAQALCGVEMDLARARDRLEHERVHYWMHALRQRQEAVTQAVAELSCRKLARQAGQPVDCVEQQEALMLARRQVEEAEEKLKNLRRARVTMERAVAEYQGQARQLADLVEGDPPGAVLPLERILAALDSYVALSPGAPGLRSPPPAPTTEPPSAPSDSPRSGDASGSPPLTQPHPGGPSS